MRIITPHPQRNIWQTLFFLAVILFLFACSKDTNSIRIGIIGDQFGTYNAYEAYNIMDTAVQKLSAHNPHILLHVGDMVESVQNVKSYNDYKNLFDRASGIMGKPGLPWLVAIGDHDVVPPGYKPLSSNRSREEWFLSLAKTTSLPMDSLPYYSFSYKNYHFISLYSMEYLHTDPRWGSIFLNGISDNQLEWLKTDLEQNKSSDGIIVIVHHPHWYVWSNWYPVHDILRQYNVFAVIAGHYHYDQDEGYIDGIRYLVMGSSGGVIKDTDAHSGGTHMYGVLDMDRTGIQNIRLYDVFGDTLLELTSRRSMDRIQALSCMLDNLYQDLNLFIDGSAKGNNKDPRISLSSLANPIDIPVHITVETEPGHLLSSSWNISDHHVLSQNGVILPPGDRTGWSNYTNTGNWFTLSPLWIGKLNEEKNMKNCGIPLIVTVSFKDTRIRHIKKIINIQ